jgi:hypothetical protein
LLGQSTDAPTLALLCRLAGHTRNQQFIAVLAKLGEHADAEVQDAAAIGLGLLGDLRARDRLQRLAQGDKDGPKLPPRAVQMAAESRLVLGELDGASKAP